VTLESPSAVLVMQQVGVGLTESSRHGVVDADTSGTAVELRLKAVVVASTPGVDELDAGCCG